jgi:integrase
VPQTLSSTEVAALAADGDHYVDRNLRLQIRNGGKTRSWVFRYQINGRLKRMGLGPTRLVTYSSAQKKAIAAQTLLLDGVDPMASRDAARQPSGMTFDQCASGYIAAHKSGWTNDKHAYQWSQSLNTYASPVIGKLSVAQVDANHIVKILQPIWSTKSETADKLRSRLERVLDWARASGYRSGENPAKWKGELQHRLPPLSRVQVIKSHVAVPYADVPALYAKLSGGKTVSAKALMMVMLTASRVGEVLGATWQEFELDAEIPIWTIPATRMKMRRPHRVPLSTAAVALVKALQREDGKPTDLVFNGQVRGKKLSDAAVRKLLRKVSFEDADTHGLRSSFRDWCADKTTYPREVPEMALAHNVGSEVERAYFRSDLIEQRAKLMGDWAKYLAEASS